MFSDSLDTSHDVYPRMAFMTVFTVHPEAIIQGQKLQRPQLLTGKLQYKKQQIVTSVEGFAHVANLLGL